MDEGLRVWLYRDTGKNMETIMPYRGTTEIYRV